MESHFRIICYLDKITIKNRGFERLNTSTI